METPMEKFTGKFNGVDEVTKLHSRYQYEKTLAKTRTAVCMGQDRKEVKKKSKSMSLRLTRPEISTLLPTARPCGSLEYTEIDQSTDQ